MTTNVATRLRAVRASLPDGVRLLAVSKYHTADDILEAYRAGQRMFGESRVQELQAKHEALPKDIEWHFIGHLQTNKVKYIAPYIAMIHSVDSPRLLHEINLRATACHRQIPVLLEIHVAAEETKSGMTPDECRQLLAGGQWRQMAGVSICGLMTMATNTDDEARIEADFAAASKFFDEVKAEYFADCDTFSVRSWGMSHDYQIAVRQDADLVRIGSRIFAK